MNRTSLHRGIHCDPRKAYLGAPDLPAYIGQFLTRTITRTRSYAIKTSTDSWRALQAPWAWWPPLHTMRYIIPLGINRLGINRLGIKRCRMLPASADSSHRLQTSAGRGPIRPHNASLVSGPVGPVTDVLCVCRGINLSKKNMYQNELYLFSALSSLE